MEQTNYPLHVTHGYAIPTLEAIAFCEFLRKTKKLVGPRRHRGAGQGAARGAALRRARAGAPAEAAQAERGHLLRIRHPRGADLLSLLPAHERRKDPLLCFCAEYAGLRSRSVEHAWELCKWTDALFEPPGPKETPDERRLRYAACLISDIGWREHPDYRGEQSLNLLAHAGLSGIDHPGRVFMALAVFYRHAGASQEHADELSERLKSARLQARAEAGPYRRRGRPHRPHAVDRRGRRHRRDAA